MINRLAELDSSLQTIAKQSKSKKMQVSLKEKGNLHTHLQSKKLLKKNLKSKLATTKQSKNLTKKQDSLYAPAGHSGSLMTEPKLGNWPRKSKKTVEELALPVDYSVPGTISPIAQTKTRGCWATVFTMLLSWKRMQSISVEDSLDSIGQKWVNLYNSNTGISASDKSDFISDANLVAEPFHNPSIEGWEHLLRTYGPLWVTTDEKPNQPWGIHARIITSIRGDGTATGTSFTIIDPSGGRQYQETIKDFLPKYEAEIIERGEKFNRVQIIHWPKDATYGLTKSFGRVVASYGSTSSAFADQSFDVGYEVVLIPQQTGMSCWAASAAMLVGWRDKVSIDPSEIANAVGYWKQYKKGLHPEDKTIFPVWGMKAEPPMSYTVGGFKTLLENNGPLWVASAEPGAHVRVVTRMAGDGTPNGTYVYINDPWDRNKIKFSLPNQGSQYRETYTEFVRKQAELADRESRFPNAVYVAHLINPFSSQQSYTFAMADGESSFSLSPKSLQELQGVHTDLVAVVKRAIQITSQDFAVHDGIRTLEEQKKLVNSGASKTMNSRHLTGHAVDLVPYVNGKLRWEWEPIYVIADSVRKAAKDLGTPIRWGGAWDLNLTETNEPTKDIVEDYRNRRQAEGKNAFLDGPHFELPKIDYPA